MALLDFLKKKKGIEKAKKSEKKTAKVSVAKPKEQKAEPVVKPAVQTKAGKFSYDAVKQPHISEKATYLSEKNQYVFEVLPSYNKNEIKKAVEGLYGVNVLSIKTSKIPSKRRRLGRTEGFRKAYRKAIVKIKEGQKIEIL